MFLRIPFNVSLRNVSPGAEMHLIDRNRRVHLLTLRTLLYPRLVLPLVLMYVGDNTGGQGGEFSSEAILVGFFKCLVFVKCEDCILLTNTTLDSGNEQFPDRQVRRRLGN